MKRLAAPNPEKRIYTSESMISFIRDGASTYLTKEYPGYAIGFKAEPEGEGVFRKAVDAFNRKSGQWEIVGGNTPSQSEISRFKQDVYELAKVAPDIKDFVDSRPELKVE